LRASHKIVFEIENEKELSSEVSEEKKVKEKSHIRESLTKEKDKGAA
jgi:hypothetical protein